MMPTLGTLATRHWVALPDIYHFEVVSVSNKGINGKTTPSVSTFGVTEEVKISRPKHAEEYIDFTTWIVQ